MGYWKGSGFPITTTAENFFENFNFFTPIAGPVIFLTIIGMAIMGIGNIISPTTTYKYHDYHNDLKISYNTSGQDVTGKIEYLWDDDDGQIKIIKTKFTGKLIDNQLQIELQDNIVKNVLNNGNLGSIPKTFNLSITQDKINFLGMTTKKI